MSSSSIKMLTISNNNYRVSWLFFFISFHWKPITFP
jgi:hypothetical protein